MEHQTNNGAVTMRKIIGALVALGLFAGAPAAADNMAPVKAFYEDLLSNPKGADLGDRVRAVVVEDWVSTPQPRGGPGAEGFVKSLQGFGKKIPDLKWSVQEILQDGDRYIVRSIATGTPQGKFFGVEAKAGFKIMTIDIHTVKDGKIVQSYHVEDWARAMRQITGGAKKH
jgi:predicted ester cyclase